MENKKSAIVLFNLGGPDKKESVKPFLFNLFNDKYIITVPKFFRYIIAWIISSRRNKEAQEIYQHLGGKSPILEETQKQANALKTKLISDGINSEVFVCMRHWHPMSDEVVEKIENYDPDEIILLPLYPQFSTTTALSSIEDFTDAIKGKKLEKALLKTVCCYPNEFNFLKSHVNLINSAIKSVKDKNNFRILFSAHGLPKKIIKDGDPYQWQVNNSVMEIVNLLAIDNLDYKITYQSKVGPLEWLGPDTEDEIKQACSEQKELVIVPIAFVSEHSETLVELDIEYKEIADKHGINYIRVPALGVCDFFVSALADIVKKASNYDKNFISSSNMSRVCPKKYSKCKCNI